MDAFESLVAKLLEWNGYWTRLNYKVNLSVEDKKAVGKPSMPRPEVDILAYKPSDNLLLWVECKSYLDSPGVPIEAFKIEDGPSPEGTYKVFTNTRYRQTVSQRLIEQTLEEGLVQPAVSLQYCLVAGHVKSGSLVAITRHFAEKGWLFYDVEWIRAELKKLATLGYENDLAVMVAKLFVKK